MGLKLPLGLIPPQGYPKITISCPHQPGVENKVLFVRTDLHPSLKQTMDNRCMFDNMGKAKHWAGKVTLELFDAGANSVHIHNMVEGTRYDLKERPKPPV